MSQILKIIYSHFVLLFRSYFHVNFTNLIVFQNSLSSKLPGRNNRTNGSYWELIKEMIAPGYDDGSESPFANMKFPLINDPIVQATGIAPAANVFLTPLGFKPENSISAVQKAYAMQQRSESTSESNNHKDSSPTSKHSPHLITTPDGIPTFRAGELTVSLKNTKNSKSDYDHGQSDLAKMDFKDRFDWMELGIARLNELQDLSKVPNYISEEFAKLSGVSFSELAKPMSSSAYSRTIASMLAGIPPGKNPPSEHSESNDRRSADFPDITVPFKPPTSSSPAPKAESNRSNTSAEDYSTTSEKKKQPSAAEPMDTSGSFSGTEDLSMSSSKQDFGAMLDMSTKKQQHSIDSGDSLNLSKDRQ